MDPDQLLEHAERVISSGQVGAPRQVDLRRGVSASYYALFHALCARASATFAGVTTAYSNYGVLIYRALDHGKAKDACIKLSRTHLSNREAAFFGRPDLSTGLGDVARIFVALQALRHDCDYNPVFRLSRVTAQNALADARAAVRNLGDADPVELREFLAYLLFGLR